MTQEATITEMVRADRIAEIFLVTPATVLRWARLGVIPVAARTAGLIWFREAAVVAALEQRAQRPAAQ